MAETPEKFGSLGQPINRAHPFVFGFLGGLGLLIAFAVGQAVVAASQVLVLIITALFLAIGLNPAVEFFRRRGLSRGSAVTVMLVIIVLLTVALAAAVIPPIISQTTDLLSNAPDWLNQLRNNSTIAHLDEQYGIISRIQEQLTSRVQDGKLVFTAFGGVVGVGRTVLSGVFSGITVLILTLYFLAALPKITATGYQLVPASRRERVQLLTDEILLRVGGYVGGQLTVASLSGLSTLVVTSILGVPYAISLAMVVALFGLIPLIGATLGAIAVVTVGLSVSLTTAIILFVFYVLYQQFENYFIYPRIMRRSVNIPAAITLVAALIGGSLLGLLGGLLAIPTAAAVLLILNEVVIPRAGTN